MGFVVKPAPEGDEGIARGRQAYLKRFGHAPSHFIKVPGRVNIIGEHIDYCGYGVLPMAIEPCILLSIGVSKDNSLKLVNVNHDKYPEFNTSLGDEIEIDSTQPQWWNYFLCGVKGVLEACSRSKIGFNCIVDGSIPPASGLSSSSAVVVSAALATLTMLNDLNAYNPADFADLCAKAERFIGTQGGGMDQAIEILAVENKAHFIEFNPIRTKEVQLPEGARFVIANSLAEANKAAGSEFNQRVVECRLATKVLAKILKQDLKSVGKLMDVHQAAQKSLPEMLQIIEKDLHQEAYTKDELLSLLDMTAQDMNSEILTPNTQHLNQFQLYQRAYHVFSEAHRVEEYQRICASSPSLKDLGHLMYDSHASCANFYQCSHPNLDQLVQLSRDFGAFGARLTGAGWGGCIVALVANDQVDDYIGYLQEKYYFDKELAKGNQSYIFPTKPGPGAQVFSYCDE